jgi:hypothetical protein
MSKELCDKIELLHDCMIELVKVNQSMNCDMIKMQEAIINTHNMLCDLLAKKND